MRAWPVLVALLVVAPGARADWPEGGLPLTEAAGHQSSLVATGDAIGGAFVAWSHPGGATGTDLFVQRIGDDGTIGAGWPVNGAPLCTAPGNQTKLALAADGAGGVYAAWRDARDATPRIYLQHLDASGGVASGWPVNGQAVGSVVAAQDEVALATGAVDGVYVAWVDDRDGTHGAYLLRVAADGAVESGWPAAGLAVADGAVFRESPRLVRDAEGGVFVAWLEKAFTSSAAQDVRATRFLSTGDRAAGWLAGGLAVADTATAVLHAAPADEGGLYLAWLDWARFVPVGCGGSPYSAHRVGADGVPAWPAPVELPYYDVSGIAADGTGGFLYVKQSDCLGSHWASVGRVLGSGDVVYESGVCPGTLGNQLELGFASDGAGGVFLAWKDQRGFDEEIMGNRLTASGAEAAGWSDLGMYVTHAPPVEANPVVVRTHGADPSEPHAIVAWTEVRGADRDVFAQQLVPTEPGAHVTAVGRGPSAALAMSIGPNPSPGRLSVRYTLPRTAPARIDVFDASGRRVARRELDGAAGAHALTLDDARTFRAGVYVVRLTQGDATATARLAVLR